MVLEEIMRRKLDRARFGGKPRVLDLFSGCGGISLGFHSAGFDIVGAVELDPSAAQSHALNFHKNLSLNDLEVHAKARDITRTEPEDLLVEYGLFGDVRQHVDVIVGGPPCQAFARVGRAKLREVATHPEAYLKDPRGNLYLRYLEYVAKLRPIALMMENVPDVLNYGGHNIAEEVCEALEDMGYVVHYSMLNAVYYGVPEMRERMFLVAYWHEIEPQDFLPQPTHWVELPKGYHGSRQVALKTIRTDLFAENSYYIDPPIAPIDSLLPAVTAQEAISDLPKITCHLEGNLKKGARRFTEKMSYPNNSILTSYQIVMRYWKEFEATDGVFDHVIRYLPRDYQIFERMNPGDQYPEAHLHAHDLLDEHIKKLERQTGKTIEKGSEEYVSLYKEIVPPYDPNKFPNKWRKMEADSPARTLMAHLGKDGYSHIHYDSAQARTISVREAARLQSFPDGFKFSGSMNAAFRQIGNAVPPLLSKAIAEVIIRQLRRGHNEEQIGLETANAV